MLKHLYKRYQVSAAVMLLPIGLGSPFLYAQTNQILLANGNTSEWEEETFSGRTRYETTTFEDQDVLKAVSTGTASGLILKKQIDLLQTPYVNWSWLIKEKLPNLDEQTKNGDDYAARIYVIIDGGLMVWKTQSLNYVWSSSQDMGKVWDNAYVGPKVKMVAVRGSDSNTHQWYQEKRNVYQDLITYMGDKGSDEANRKAYQYIDAIAIMTDTDNSQSKAETYYGKITFSVN
ncbi:DUF3047 domain-containing protein [Vibrio sp. S9_S30]|uniref:DUF3047 domain-containing protein n=1 Tax=Vibrio sp. S9_S30 TaxID=2720226 RepID=UPI001DB91363|nr:DUF3047 domain-containing protein [Vibrio sp. S9_S30]MBD1557193.1 DUF3047 domain-containing protein [Vibrio sp. S9_S30]